MLDQYKVAFTKLRSDAVPSRWTSATNHRAPHKPLLLLTIMDLIEQGNIRTNFIAFDAVLLDTFELYWVKVIGQDKAGSPLLPFFHLRSEGFWHLIPQAGMEEGLTQIGKLRSLRELHTFVLGARFDDDLFNLLLTMPARNDLRRVLIERYFAPELRPRLVEVGKVAAESFAYSRELMNRSRGMFKIEEPPVMDHQYLTESRSTAFRRIVVHAYKHTCAVCGIRLVTPEGRTAVAASHIIPWSRCHNDDPRNGMALCGLHHWTFDQGLITVTQAYRITVSPTLSGDEAGAEALLSLAGAAVKLPLDQFLWPAKEALRWHGRNIFRGEVLGRLL